MSLVRYLPTPSDRMGILWTLLCVKDSVIVEYGPAGTTHYSMGLFMDLGIQQQNRLFSTHMSEDDVVMGDVSRLEHALVEVDEGYNPRVIFVVASSVSAVIGTDLKGVCNYMQEKVNARLIAFEQGGFRGDYSIGLKEAYRLLANDIVKETAEEKKNTYNIIGLSAGNYRAESDANEIKRLMKEAFNMDCQACMCWDTDVESIENAGTAKVNLVLRDEARDAAKIIEKRCAVPSVFGAPYGFKGTLKWLEEVSKVIGKEINPRVVMRLKKRMMEMRSYRMYPMMLRVNQIAVSLMGDYMTVKGLAEFMDEIGFPVKNKVSAHSLRLIENPDESIRHLPVEKDRIELLKTLDHQLVLADDVSAAILNDTCTFHRVSMPIVNGAQISAYLPVMGERGADILLESVEEYLQTLK